MKGMGWVLSISQLGAAEIQPGKHPNCAGGGELIWQVHNCRKLLCRAQKSFHMHAKLLLVMLPLHHHHPHHPCTCLTALAHVSQPLYTCPALIHMSQPSYTCPGPCTHFTILIHMSLPQSMHHGITHYFST